MIYLFIIIVVVAIYALIVYLRKIAIKKIFIDVEKVKRSLENLIESSKDDTYIKILNNSNPEELWVRVYSKYNNDRKTLGILSGKIISLTAAIQRVIQLDSDAQIIISAGATAGENPADLIQDLDKMRAGKINIITVIDQLTKDIKEKI
ncbi:MAG: hypothetical protein PHE24_04505 [Patescibacteria group bacterium]|nr:hypothetical protein [Patescibacteria group bacterium]